MRTFLFFLVCLTTVFLVDSKPLEAKTRFNIGLNFDFTPRVRTHTHTVRVPSYHYYQYSPQPTTVYYGPAIAPVLVPAYPQSIAPLPNTAYYYY